MGHDDDIADYWLDQVGYATQAGDKMTNDSAEKKSVGRPTKGDAVRSAMVSVRVEPWVVQAIDNAREAGESRADVLTRWAVASQLP
tara:strand:- start:6449 stop:6706 length:258 start_codon:yes stop_codon:yes gene_type:complete